jgi:V/A-type H+-transporting ATPase subunit D
VTALRVPPGRAGRLWLRDRLQLAEHGLSLLEKKLTILDQDRARLRGLADQAHADWESTCRQARTWQLRAELLGGQHSLSLATPVRAATLTVHWITAAGVRYPGAVDVANLDPTPDTVVGTATLARAAAAHRAAVRAAARYAAADAAATAVEREFTATRVRVQGLRRRRIPDLRAALARVELTLEEQERSEAIQLRRALSG